MGVVVEQLNAEGPCRTWLVGDAGSRQAILIDPLAHSFEVDHARLGGAGWVVSHVIDTHTHADHASGARAWRSLTGCEHAVASTSGTVGASLLLEDGDVVRAGDVMLTVVHTPGHTRDSMCLLADGHLFTGDTLFLGEHGVGRDDLPTGSMAEHFASLARLRSLPRDSMVHPGHDYWDSGPGTLAEVMELSPAFACATLADYEAWMSANIERIGPLSNDVRATLSSNLGRPV